MKHSYIKIVSMTAIHALFSLCILNAVIIFLQIMTAF